MMTIFRSLALLFAFVASSSLLSAQDWYYSGTKSCMNFGNGISQCFSQGFVNRMSYDRPRSYEDVHRAYVNGQQAGEGVGSLVGVLVGLWAEHHRAVAAESKDLRSELAAYQHAQDEALQSQLDMENEDARMCDELSRLDAANSEHWKQGAAYSREMESKIRSIKEQTEQVEAMELKEKSPKALHQIMDDPQHGVKWRVDYQRRWAAQVYVIHEFLVARVGSYSQKPSDASTNAAPLSRATDPHANGQSAATVTVERTTANADVYLDGEYVGSTPAVLHVAPGNHLVRLSAGKEMWERTLAVSDGADLRLRPSL